MADRSATGWLAGKVWVAIGAVVGGQVGAGVGRRLPSNVLRFAIIVVGTIVGVRLLLG